MISTVYAIYCKYKTVALQEPKLEIKPRQHIIILNLWETLAKRIRCKGQIPHPKKSPGYC